MPIFKEFGEKFGPEQKKRIASAIDDRIMTQANVDGESVMYAAQRLLKQKQPSKIMIVLSDGEPAGPGDGSELRSHLKQVVKDLTKVGVNMVGVGIQTHSVEEFYPKSIHLNNIEDLPKTVIHQIRDAILVKA
jgi:cobalamin biosynthesis protein CobT